MGRRADVLFGTGRCTVFDAMDILKKGRQPVTGCVVELAAERAPEPPRVFTRITMRLVVTRRGLSRAAVERAAELSAEMYCSASIMLPETVAMVREIELCEAEATEGRYFSIAGGSRSPGIPAK